MGRVNAAGIDHGKDAAIPFRISKETVTGGAGGVIYNSHPFPDQTVKERGLSYIRSSYKCNNWFHTSLLYGFGVGEGMGVGD